MLEKSGMIRKVEELAVELLRGSGHCSDSNNDGLAIVMSDAADGLLALLDALVATSGTSSCGEATAA